MILADVPGHPGKPGSALYCGAGKRLATWLGDQLFHFSGAYDTARASILGDINRLQVIPGRNEAQFISPGIQTGE